MRTTSNIEIYLVLFIWYDLCGENIAKSKSKSKAAAAAAAAAATTFFPPRRFTSSFIIFSLSYYDPGAQNLVRGRMPYTNFSLKNKISTLCRVEPKTIDLSIIAGKLLLF